MRDATLEPLQTRVRESQPAGARKPLRILFSCYRAHPHVGGQGVYTSELTRTLADLGHSVDVVAGPPYPELDSRIGLIKLPSLDLFQEKNAFFAFRPSMLARWPDLAEWALHNTGAFGEPFAFGARLARWLGPRINDYDVLHDNQGLFRELATLPRRGLATTATIHHPITVDLKLALDAAPSFTDRVFLRRWHGFIQTQIAVAKRLPALLTVSHASKEAIARDFGVAQERIAVSHNGVDHEVFHPRPQIARERDLIAAAASADVPLKGLSTLIAAFARVAAQRPGARLKVIGRLRDGPAADVLAKTGLRDRVEFVSGLTREEIASIYASASVIACPSLFEGFGFPAAEAMACGAPIASSNGGALPEVVGEAGLIAPAGDAEALADALLTMLNDDGLRAEMSVRSIARAKSAFSWRAHGEAALELYERAGAYADHHA